MGSDESHFNVSLIVRNKVTRLCPQTTTFEEKRRAEAVSNRGPSAYQPTALPLGQTGSHRECYLSLTVFIRLALITSHNYELIKYSTALFAGCMLIICN